MPAVSVTSCDAYIERMRPVAEGLARRYARTADIRLEHEDLVQEAVIALWGVFKTHANKPAGEIDRLGTRAIQCQLIDRWRRAFSRGRRDAQPVELDLRALDFHVTHGCEDAETQLLRDAVLATLRGPERQIADVMLAEPTPAEAAQHHAAVRRGAASADVEILMQRTGLPKRVIIAARRRVLARLPDLFHDDPAIVPVNAGSPAVKEQIMNERLPDPSEIEDLDDTPPAAAVPPPVVPPADEPQEGQPVPKPKKKATASTPKPKPAKKPAKVKAAKKPKKAAKPKPAKKPAISPQGGKGPRMATKTVDASKPVADLVAGTKVRYVSDRETSRWKKGDIATIVGHYYIIQPAKGGRTVVTPGAVKKA